LELPQKAHIQVESDLGALAQVLSWFDQFSRFPIPHLAWLECQLMLAEGFTNAVRHAHRDRPGDLPIDIEVTVRADALELRVWDFGDEFDLQQKLDALPSDQDPYAEGGRGLRLLQRMADILRYTRMADQRNCLLVVKHYTVSPELAKVPPEHEQG
jgi:serine/threonine-protein kinase RsbW